MKLLCPNCEMDGGIFMALFSTHSVDQNETTTQTFVNPVQLYRCTACGMTDHQSTFHRTLDGVVNRP